MCWDYFDFTVLVSPFNEDHSEKNKMSEILKVKTRKFYGIEEMMKIARVWWSKEDRRQRKIQWIKKRIGNYEKTDRKKCNSYEAQGILGDRRG